MLDISSRLISLIQSLLPPEIGSLSSLVQENEQEMEQKSSTILPLSVRIPASIRSVAFLTLGKVCLRDQVSENHEIGMKLNIDTTINTYRRNWLNRV